VQVRGTGSWLLRSDDLGATLEGGGERMRGLLLDTTTVLRGVWNRRGGG
jgi:hypothetical protein